MLPNTAPASKGVQNKHRSKMPRTRRKWLMCFPRNSVRKSWRQFGRAEIRRPNLSSFQSFAPRESKAGEGTQLYPADLTSFSPGRVWHYSLMGASGTVVGGTTGCRRAVCDTGRRRSQRTERETSESDARCAFAAGESYDFGNMS